MNIIECQDKDGITVVCSKDTWEKHILPRHDEMKGREAHVKAVIQHPWQIFQDSVNIDKHIIYNPAVFPGVAHVRYLRVIINYKIHKYWGKRGYVESALGCWNMKGGDVLIWSSMK